MPDMPFDIYNNPYMGGVPMGGNDPFMVSQRALQQFQFQNSPMQNPMPGMDLGFGAPFGSSPMAQVGNIFANMASQQFSRSYGYQGFNVLGPTYNVAGVMRNRQEMAYIQEMMMTAGKSPDSVGLQGMQRMGTNLALWMGANPNEAAIRGQEWGTYLNNTMNDPAAMMTMNIGGQMLGFDILGFLDPQRAMSLGFAQASLGMYGGAGRFGKDALTAAQAAQMATTIGQQFYPGGKMDLQATRGFTGGEIGNMMVTMQRNNLLPGLRMGSEMDANEVQALAAKDFSGDTAKAVTQINAEQVKGRISDYTKVFQVAREITGSSDMDQLMSAIQAFSGGAAGKMSTGSIENQMLKAQELIRAARISADQMIYLVQQGSAAAQQSGFSGTVGANMAMSNVLTATAMTGAGSKAFGGQDTPYSMNFNEMIVEGQKQYAGALTSPAASRVGALLGQLSEIESLAPGSTLKLRNKANKTADEVTAVNTLDTLNRIKEGNATPADWKMVRDGAIFSAGSQLLTTGFGMTQADAMAAMNNQRLTARGLQENSGLLDAIANGLNIEETTGMVRSAISDTVAKVSGLTDTQKVSLTGEMSDLLINRRTGGLKFNQLKAQIAKTYGLNDDQMLALMENAAVQRDIVLGQPSRENLNYRQALGEDQEEIRATESSLRANAEVSRIINAKGGSIPGVATRLRNFALEPGNTKDKGPLMDLIGSISDAKLKGELTDVINTIEKNKKIVDEGITTEEREAAIKSKTEAEAKVKKAEDTLYELGKLKGFQEKDVRDKSKLWQDATADLAAGIDEVETAKKQLAKKDVTPEARAKAIEDNRKELQRANEALGGPAVSPAGAGTPSGSGVNVTTGTIAGPSKVEGTVTVNLGTAPLGTGVLELWNNNPALAIARRLHF